jgi:hypothetical protein
MTARIPEAIPGASVRGGRPTVRLLSMNGLTAARISFDVDGASGKYERLEHTVSYAVWSPEGTYVFVLNTGSTNAAAFDALADELASTIRLTHPAPPMPK